jgi:hypothetical protein
MPFSLTNALPLQVIDEWDKKKKLFSSYDEMRNLVFPREEIRTLGLHRKGRKCYNPFLGNTWWRAGPMINYIVLESM